MRENNTKQEILEQIARANTIQIAGHTNPDGDAIGACLAMGAALVAAGKKVTVLLEAYAPKYTVIPNGHLVKAAEGPADLFLALDCGDEGRLGQAAEWFHQAAYTINIDHHGSNTRYGQMNYVEGDASSTCEIVYGFLEGNYEIDRDMASGLYAGLIYDTGGFRHSSTSPETMRIAGELMKKGIPFTEIYNRFFDSRSFSELKIMGQALENAALFFDGKVVCATVTTEEIVRCHGTNKELDAIINYLNGVQGTAVACFLYEKTPTEVKASFRGKDGYDVCALAQKFGGGGHVKAAGCTIAAPIEKAKEMVLAEMEKML
ncbi:bifunctional oligoribonuclease/PAP phosphatase NrnA [Anaerotignum lactatifermentans]|uniref:Bifunctional oligoribonuclease/PAP phosphatase NrnA n=1 Tax=Anaerotignum lactatifermentans TaxID=160404 RepID=A0ABS2G5I2_9FIRM|nr:bifunctional oligoribonuclease/PAP phosphatase NrnA [Anaerotignum lactatifermentans]MBM6828136.1 bifunctional oligoribonuclease/PAP phosphatase NrnA [Anaerotignum lactatifermentans]MBM6876701.1 bifunctional oligoribonuclease/PAP phosphatase NrnA [Anaerotignum lactatifermentans]MBM6949719.1 bifunctional oligoribonuclease/PAP phosphatase NrnA [Anaerotignum lactatifermentans]